MYNIDSYHKFVKLPAVIQGCNTSHIEIDIVTLDLESAREQWESFFLIPMGVIDQGMEKMSSGDSSFLSHTYPYDYRDTVSVERDHHVNFDNVPENIAYMFNVCYPAQPELNRVIHKLLILR